MLGWTMRGALAAACVCAFAVGCGDDEGTGPTGGSGPLGGGGAGATATGGAGGSTGGAGGGVTNPCAEQHAALDSLLATHAEAQAFGGLVAAADIPGCPLWTGGAGDAGGGESLDGDSLVRIGSVTKTYVAAVTLDLVAAGQLALDDTLEDVGIMGVPDGNLITVAMLLQHTSGVFNYTDDNALMIEYINNPTTPVQPQDIVDGATKSPATFPPGMGWSYSNTGYILLGMVIEQVTGGTAGEAVHSVTDPIGLSRTFFDGEDTLDAELPTGFGTLGSDETYALHPTVPWTAGNMVTDMADLAVWIGALYRGDVLDATSTDLLTSSAVEAFPGTTYGYGTLILPPSASGGVSKVVGHTGGIPGFGTQAWYFPAVDSVLVANGNSDGADVNSFVAEALPIVFGD